MFFVVGEERGVGFGCGRLFDFEWKGEGVGAYSTWALIRGWALIRINMVYG